MKNRTFGYASIQTFFWMCYASVMGFASMFLLDRGFDNSRVGILIAAAGLLSALLQPVIAAYADRPGSLSLGRLITLSDALPKSFVVCRGYDGERVYLTGLSAATLKKRITE